MAIEKTINLSPTSEENTAYQTSGSVSTRDFKILRKKADGLSASLLVAQQEIDLRVLSSDYNGNTLVSLINLQPDTIKIQAKNLVLTGLVTFNNLANGGETTINGSNITTGALNANLITVGTLSADRIYGGTINGSVVNVTNLNASNINAGSLSVDRLTVGTVSGWYFGSSSISRNGITLGADYISLGNQGTSGSTINLGSAKIYNYFGSSVGVSSNFYAQGLVTCQGINSNGTIRSTDDAAHALGTSGFRFTEVWAVDGSINTSDMEDKVDIMSIDKGVDLVLTMKPVQFKWKDKVRLHYGFLAQEVKESMTQVGIDDAGVYIDPAMSGEEGHKGLRYTELIAPMVQTIQHLNERITSIENARAL